MGRTNKFCGVLWATKIVGQKMSTTEMLFTLGSQQTKNYGCRHHRKYRQTDRTTANKGPHQKSNDKEKKIENINEKERSVQSVAI